MNFLFKAVASLGHATNGVLYLGTSLLLEGVEGVARFLGGALAFVTRATITLPPYPKQLISVKPVYMNGSKDLIDEKASKAASSFPIKEAALIDKCKEVIRSQFGCNNPSLLSDDFLFIFPLVGPLSKEVFIEAFSSFKMESAMTGSANYFGFMTDPLEPNRVWFFSRSELVHSGIFNFGLRKFQPTGKTVESVPQVLSMSFTPSGLCYKFTGGYSVDRTVGNTGGLGGVFGILHAVGGGLPFPEAKPWRPSLRWETFARHFPEILKIWKSKA